PVFRPQALPRSARHGRHRPRAQRPRDDLGLAEVLSLDPNGKELAAKGYLYQRPLHTDQRDWVGPGYANTYYDTYSPEARAIYFRQIREGLVSKGFDAW